MPSEGSVFVCGSRFGLWATVSSPFEEDTRRARAPPAPRAGHLLASFLPRPHLPAAFLGVAAETAPWDVRPGCRARFPRVAPDVELTMHRMSRVLQGAACVIGGPAGIALDRHRAGAYRSGVPMRPISSSSSSATRLALAFALLVPALAGAQEDPHAACAEVGWVPREILERPVPLRDGTGRAHTPVTTSSKEAQAFHDQGLAYLHSYVWIEAAR